ncbi:MAG: YetF domain-containing protein [Dokdonella sp.]
MDTNFDPLNWQRLLLGLAPPLYLVEILLRIVMLFLVLLLVVRLLGKREHQSLSPMQQMLMIALGSAAGDVMLYPEISIAYAALVLVGVTVLTIGLENLANRSRALRDYLESRPRVLVCDGRVDHDALRIERTTERELFASLRGAGAVALAQVDIAVLEVTGAISVILNEVKPATRDLIEYLIDPAVPQPGGDDSKRRGDNMKDVRGY